MKTKLKSKTRAARSCAPSPGSARSWQPIKTAPKTFLHEIDLWLVIHPSARSMGMGDSFRVTDAFWMDEQPKEYRAHSLRDDYRAGWFHHDHGKQRRLDDDYITHWMPIPEALNDEAHRSAGKERGS